MLKCKISTLVEVNIPVNPSIGGQCLERAMDGEKTSLQQPAEFLSLEDKFCIISVSKRCTFTKVREIKQQPQIPL